jgi:hypothetical protein
MMDKERFKKSLLFSMPSLTLAYESEKNLELRAELDIYNNHIYFYVLTDINSYEYEFDNIEEAIDKFYELLE